MKRTSPKRAVSRKPAKRKRSAKAAVKDQATEHCTHCEKKLQTADKALYVEEEVGRTFCSEECIAQYFAPEIQRLEKEYFKYLPKEDLSSVERERHADLRWATIQEPQEMWREKTLSGDYRYTLISEYQVRSKTIWSVCICLLLRGEPSFLYLAFVTRKEEFVDHYRKGERVQRVKTGSKEAKEMQRRRDEEAFDAVAEPGKPTDGLAEPWTEDELQRADRIQTRRKDDIPADRYSEYEGCVEQTLEKPDEVWSYLSKGREITRYFHFIRQYKEASPAHWYVIVARETDKEDQLEIMDLFPTRDAALVSRYRKGEQEAVEQEVQAATAPDTGEGSDSSGSGNRWVH
jgi:hypothetical protein